MKESKNHISEMQRLAETGWQQMHQTLLQHGMSSVVPDQRVLSAKKTGFLLIAACVFFILIFCYPYLLNNIAPISLNINKSSPAFSLNKITEQPASSNSNQPAESSMVPANSYLQRRLVYQKINAAYAQYTRENAIKLFQNQKVRLLEKFNVEQKEKILIPSYDGPIDPSVKFEKTHFLWKKNPDSFSKKIQIFAGAAMNISSAKNYADVFNSNSLNVHPEMSIVLPVNKKLSIHLGLSAFSTVHGKEVSAKEKEIVNGKEVEVEKKYFPIIPLFSERTKGFPVPIFSSGTNWPGIETKEVERFKPLIRKRAQVILLTLLTKNKFRKILLWIGAKVVLNKIITKAIMKKIRNELMEHRLLK